MHLPVELTVACTECGATVRERCAAVRTASLGERRAGMGAAVHVARADAYRARQESRAPSSETSTITNDRTQ